MILPSTDNEASHQEDEENDSPCDGHGQNGGLVRVSNGQNICKTGKKKKMTQRIINTSVEMKRAQGCLLQEEETNRRKASGR